MYKLGLKDWAAVLQVNICTDKQQLMAGLAWESSHLWSSLLQGNLYTNCIRQVQSIVCFRSTPVALEVDYLKTHNLFVRKGVMSCNFSYLKRLSQRESKPIWLEVNQSNLTAVQFYQNQGFNRVGLRPNYYKNGDNAGIYSFFPRI